MRHRTSRSGTLFGVLAVASLFAVVGCTEVEITAPPAPEIEEVEFAPELGIDLSAMEERDSGLWLQDLNVGEGEPAGEGDFLSVHYTGWLPNGARFDSSRARGRPLEFTLGANNVIPGWDEGLKGMKPGGVRLLIVPPHLAYGAQQAGQIPPNSILVFEVELLEVRDAPSG